MLRGLFVTVAAVSLAAVMFATVAAAGPPTSQITVTCTTGGQTMVSGFKGNPSKIRLLWTDSTGQDLFGSGYSTDIGGKYGHQFLANTPAMTTTGRNESVEAWIWYGNATTAAWQSGVMYCSGQ